MNIKIHTMLLAIMHGARGSQELGYKVKDTDVDMAMEEWVGAYGAERSLGFRDSSGLELVELMATQARIGMSRSLSCDEWQMKTVYGRQRHSNVCWIDRWRYRLRLHIMG